jgi:ATP-binding cassette subfamily F protein 3
LAPTRRASRKQEAQERQRLASARKPLQNQLQKVEAELARVSASVRELDARLADPDFYHAGEPAEVARVLKARGELAVQVEELEARWLELTGRIEAIA